MGFILKQLQVDGMGVSEVEDASLWLECAQL
jgi:hypothetical protein